MSRVYGLCCHSPEELIIELLKVTKSPTYFTVPIGSLLIDHEVRPQTKNILILTAKDFIRNWKAFERADYKNKNIFIFAPYDVLLEYTGIVKLDMEVTESTSGMLTFALKEYIDLNRYMEKVDEVVLKRKKLNYVNTLISDVRKGSLLNALMTFVYMLPVKTHQKPVKILCGLYLTQQWTERKLNSQISLLDTKIGLSTKVKEALLDILLNPVALRLQQAFSELPSYEDTDTTAKLHDVSGYEIRYIINMLMSEDAYAKKTKTSIDDYLDNK